MFANPIGTIWDAILWASEQAVAFLHADLSIVVNGRNFGAELPPAALRAAAVARGGDLVRFDRSGAVFAADWQRASDSVHLPSPRKPRTSRSVKLAVRY